MKFIKEMWKPTLFVLIPMLLFMIVLHQFRPQQRMLVEEESTETELVIEEVSYDVIVYDTEPIPEPEESLESTYEISFINKDFELHLVSVMQDFNINLDISYIYATIYCESSFRSNARSSSGALGYMQILPSTRDYIANLIRREFPQYSQLSSDLYDPKTNVIYGLYYFRYIASQFGESEVNGNNINKILTCYNRGVGGGNKYYNSTGSWDSSYSNKVSRVAEQIMTNGGL